MSEGHRRPKEAHARGCVVKPQLAIEQSLFSTRKSGSVGTVRRVEEGYVKRYQSQRVEYKEGDGKMLNGSSFREKQDCNIPQGRGF